MAAWKKIKAVLSQARSTTPRPDVIVTGPAPVAEPQPGSPDRERAKKRAMLLSGLVEAGSRRGPKL